MKHLDVTVVGAGPSGGYISSLLSKSGLKVGLFEEHNEIGRPVQCAGLVSLRVFDILGDRRAVLNEIHGAQVHSPSGKTLTISQEKPKACVIDRSEFDKSLVEDAVDSGTSLFLGSKVTSATRRGNKVQIQVKKEGEITEFSSRLIIGCDGIGSKVARSFGFPKPKEVLSGFGAECIPSSELDRSHLDIFIGNKIAPGFFAWLIPTDSGARLGLCTARDKQNTRTYFENLMKFPQVKRRLGKIKIHHFISGAIPLGPSKEIVKDNVMLVGDSACQVKPLSGGGIYLGLLAAKHASRVALGAFESEDLSQRALLPYPKLVTGEVGKELRRARALRNIYLELKDEHFEEGFRVLDDEKILSYIAKKGDIDYPSGLTKSVLKKAPRLMKFAGPVLKSLI
jgi:geranylgeranyl reductase family protein